MRSSHLQHASNQNTSCFHHHQYPKQKLKLPQPIQPLPQLGNIRTTTKFNANHQLRLGIQAPLPQIITPNHFNTLTSITLHTTPHQATNTSYHHHFKLPLRSITTPCVPFTTYIYSTYTQICNVLRQL